MNMDGPPAAPPAPWYLTSGFASRHLGEREGLNENNIGLGVKSPNGWVAGGYHNSHRRVSLYAGKEFATPAAQVGPVKIQGALTTGLVSGYEAAPVLPFAMPGALFTAGGMQAALGYQPSVKGINRPSVALQIRKAF